MMISILYIMKFKMLWYHYDINYIYICIHVFKTCKRYKSVPPPGAVGAAPPAQAAPRAHPTWKPTARNNGKKQRFLNPKLLSHEAKRDNWFNCLRNCFKDFFWNNLTHLTKKASDLQMVKRVSTVTVQPENRFFSSGSSKLSISKHAEDWIPAGRVGKRKVCHAARFWNLL